MAYRGWNWIYGRIPEQRWGAGVYALYLNGELVYVGQTGNLRVRIQCHARNFEFDAVKVAAIDSRRERQFLERRLLHRVRPRFNSIIPSDLNATWWYRSRTCH